MRHKTQAQKVLEVLQAGRSLTSLDALNELGIISFPKRISELRREGYDIESEYVTVSNRAGESVSVRRYWMEAANG